MYLQQIPQLLVYLLRVLDLLPQPINFRVAVAVIILPLLLLLLLQ